MTLDDLLAKWLGTQGGAERANYQMFLSEFTDALGLPRPHPKGMGLGDYEFEAPVKSEAALGRKGTGRIDLYKRDCFILEAKQSQLKPGETPDPEPAAPPPETLYDLFGHAIGVAEPKKAAPRYDRLMADARLQAERYALALPSDHKSPPFLIVADIGRAFEVFFDWAGNGRGYAPFPDERRYRITLEDLHLPEVRERLNGIWTDPASIDPRLKAAAVTRDIAERLSRVAAELERSQRDLRPGDAQVALGIETTSLFLMRMLFCMFAEDVGLLPADSFKTFLSDAQARSAQFWRSGLADLWSRMNDPQEANRYWSYGDAIVRYFNGNLFSGTQIFDLPAEFKGELLVAAGKDWRAVEPAIFGTLLEQVLTAKDRAKLGAHYTPRPYVERLVEATMMEVLRPEWDAALERARALADGGDVAGAVAEAAAFQRGLIDLRVLDPACGTGNFLYVAMEQLLRLEGEVRQFAAGLGADLAPGIHPNQFLGLELNPRAAVIAELVLWIGWLRYRLANTPDAIGTPVLPTLTNINMGHHGGYDAVLARTDTGEPDVANPHRPEWPAADFIIGNPPFIGGKDIRARLDADQPGYAEALWKANPHVPRSADFVMQWWDRAADLLTAPDTRLRRFGFVTTNSITQVFSRRVIERHLSSPLPTGEGNERKLHLTLAIPDHPWTKIGRDAAAVRIAMTVAERGAGPGRTIRITGERDLDTDLPELTESAGYGTVNADLSIGTDVTRVVPLTANEGLCVRGVELHGNGYVMPAAMARLLVEKADVFEKVSRKYVHSSEFKQHPSEHVVFDLHHFDERTLRNDIPLLYDHLLKNALPSRTGNPVRYRRDNWWKLALPHTELREGLIGIPRFIGTIVTGKYRWFSFIDAKSLPDQGIMAVLSDSASLLGVLSSSIHLT